jgi:predicted RNase H-like HicB family nuclease
MTYRVELLYSDDGYRVACPDLPGCFSHGETEEEALRNIKSVIFERVASAADGMMEAAPHREVRYVEVPDAAGRVLEPFKVTPIAMGLPDFIKVEDLLDQLEGPWHR